jgi:hypothetical protein
LDPDETLARMIDPRFTGRIAHTMPHNIVYPVMTKILTKKINWNCNRFQDEKKIKCEKEGNNKGRRMPVSEVQIYLVNTRTADSERMDGTVVVTNSVIFGYTYIYTYLLLFPCLLVFLGADNVIYYEKYLKNMQNSPQDIASKIKEKQ